jgi:4-carboxymuconolactone decarboxylase
MNRLGLMHEAELDDDAKTFYHKVNSYTSKKYGAKGMFRQTDGRFLGPFGAQMHTPHVGEAWLDMAQNIAQIPGLTLKNREIVIVATGVRFNAAFELEAHKRRALSFGVT